MIDIKSMNLAELTAYLTENGFEKFRAKQVLNWIKQDVSSFDDMTNVPQKLRDFLKENAYLACAQIERVQRSRIDDTVKYLFRLYDGEYVEGVLMSYHHGRTMCISSQVGCKMGCTFCATGKSGFSRSLSASEMIAQIRSAELDCNERISNVVLMGMGEPFDNYEELSRFIRLIHDKKGYDLGLRNITVSTCGLIPKIKEFAADFPQVNLAVSLHAPNQKLRQQTMPVAKKYDYDELMKTCREYTELTGRRITFEYAVIDGVNDSAACAGELASRLKGWLSHVNLIPLNEVRGRNYKTANEKSVAAFKKILENNGVAVTVRRTLGSDIDAACGQLRRNR